MRCLKNQHCGLGYTDVCMILILNPQIDYGSMENTKLTEISLKIVQKQPWNLKENFIKADGKISSFQRRINVLEYN